MPKDVEIIRNIVSAKDAFGAGGQLVEDSGVMTDMDGGFDTCSCTVLIPENSSFSIGDKHPLYKGMWLFGVSPKVVIGGEYLVTLTYKGFYNRDPQSKIPAEGSVNAKFTYGIQMSQRTWAKGALRGIVDGNVDLSKHTVNVLQPLQTVKVTWIGSAKVDPNIFKIPNGKYSASYGELDENFYVEQYDAAYNFPHGWVPTDASSEQAYAGIQVFLNSVTFTAIPKYSPA